MIQEGNDKNSSGDMKDEAEAREHTMADSGGDDRADATPRKRPCTSKPRVYHPLSPPPVPR
jgi:hypothetical protein